MELGVLGQTQVLVEDGMVPLGGAQRRGVLAVLAIDGGRAVPAERLIEALWSAAPPMSAAQTVQSHVSHLRKVLGTERIDTVPGGYVLRVDDLDVDASAFEQECERGRVWLEGADPSAAVAVLDAALDRWRGRAYEDAESCERAVAEAVRLEGVRTSAIEMLLDARLSLGQHDRVAGDAESAVSRWPLRERMWASLMVALYRCGRHADALASYQRLRRILGDELGLEPSPSLADLEGRILRHDPTLLVPPSSTAPSSALDLDMVVDEPRASDEPARLGNLPYRPTALIGRQQEAQRVRAALAASRIVTLTGVGGVGKTRLAIEVAADVTDAPDGVWLCELAAVDSPEAVFQVVAATLGVPTRGGAPLSEALVDYLRTKAILLILDNCEHVLSTAGDLAATLSAACSEIRILATSREGLAIEGEQVIPIPSLAIPGPDAGVSDIAGSESVHLFIDRAHAAGASLATDDRDLSVIADVCRRLDGVPLAIELAAARTAAMSPADIAEHLDERFRLLTGGRRSAVERHQTLRAAVDWSYGLLDSQDRAVFDRLGVFAGGFDLPAAEGVVVDGEISAFDVVDALTSLVTKSMVVAERSVEGTVRYRLLETMRQYARDRLDESGTGDHWRRRHAAHYVALAREASPGFQGPDETSWRARIGEELDNLRAAVGWALDRDEPSDAQLGLEIVAALVIEAMVRRSSGIGAWTHRALDRLPVMTPAQKHDVRLGAAWELFQSGDIPAARDLARLAIAEGVPEGCLYSGGAYTALGTCEAMLGDLTAARIAYRTGRDTVRGRVDERFSTAALLAAEAMSLASYDLEPEARPIAREALRRALEVRNPTVLVLANFAVGWTLTTEDPDASRAALEESIALSEAGAIDSTLGAALARVALLRLRAGDTNGAIDALLNAFGRLRELGDWTSLASAVHSAMGVLHDLGAVSGATLAAVVLDRAELSAGPYAAVEPGRREALLDGLRETAPDLLEATLHRAAQLSTDGVLDVLAAELSGLRTTAPLRPTS